MAQYKSRAFVLGAAEYRETSQLLRVIAEDVGRISLVARGVSKSQGRHPSTRVEPLSLVLAVYGLRESETIGSLQSLETIKAWSVLRRSLTAYSLASLWLEVMSVLIQPGMPAEDLFEDTIHFLDAMEQTGASSPATWRHISSLIVASGFSLTIDQCRECGQRARIAHFDVARGTALCSHCAGAFGRLMPVNPDHGRMLACLLSGIGHGPVGDRLAVEAAITLAEFLAHHLDCRLKSRDFLLSLAGTPQPRRH